MRIVARFYEITDDLVGPTNRGAPNSSGRDGLDDRFGLGSGQPHQGTDQLVFGFPLGQNGF